MNETWKKVRGYNYEVSNLGRIRSKFTNQIMSLSSDRYGYAKLNLSKDGKKKTVSVHRLVAKAFIPNPYKKPEINHKSGNKLDNAVSNLEWVTSEENLEHAIKIGLIKVKEKVFKEPKTNKRPIKIVETGEVFESIAECARILNTKPKSISKVLTGKRHTHRGFHFKYIS